jgi:TM2 domain-containing membrane protein YozV
MTFVLVALLASVYLGWLATRSKDRRFAGMCVRCNRVPPVRTPGGADSEQRMCESCAKLTERNHRLAFWFFLGIGVLCAAVIGLTVPGDLRRGLAYPWQGVLLLAFCVVGPVGLAFWIRARTMGGTR